MPKVASEVNMPPPLPLVKRMFIIILIMDANTDYGLTRNIDVALLRAFVAVAESGSMTMAAGRLNVTQGAVSQQIKRLEDFLQKKLFERSGQGLVATRDGERLFLHAGRMISLNDEVFSLITAPAFNGEVRLGLPYDIISPFAAPILKSFSQVYPLVSVELELASSHKLKAALGKGELDIILTTETHTPKGARALLRNDLVWVGALNGEAYKQDPLPIVMCNEDCMFRPTMLSALEAVGRDWRITGAMHHMDATFAMVQADLAVTAILESTVPNFVSVLGKDNGLPNLPVFYINLYTPVSGVSEVVAELAQHVRDQFDTWRRPHNDLAV